MKNTGEKTITRRQFAGTLAVALAAPTLLPAAPALRSGEGVGGPQQERKPEAPKPPQAAPPEDEEARALKAIREFKLPEGAEPAFAFRASARR